MSAPRPTSVKVGYLTYAIHWVPDSEWILADGHNNDWIGEHQGPPATISLRLIDGVSEQYFREVLLHEITHGVWFVTTIDEPIDPDGQEEHIIGRQTPTLLQVLQDNPDVMAYLIGIDA